MKGRGLGDRVRSLDEARDDIERQRARERLRHLRIAGVPLELNDAAFATAASPPGPFGEPRALRPGGQEPPGIAEALDTVARHIAAATPPRRRRAGPIARFLRRVTLWPFGPGSGAA